MRIYLENSVLSGSLDTDEPKFMKFSNELLRSVKQNIHKGFISKLVQEEISRAPSKIRVTLERRISRLSLVVLEIDEEVLNLAKEYVDAKLVPENYRADAIHIAVATANRLDVLVSWNLAHIVRPKTINGVNEINKLKGYEEIKIMTPEMMLKCPD